MSNLAIQALITAFADGKAIAGESSTRAAISEVTADKPNRHREHHDHQHVTVMTNGHMGVCKKNGSGAETVVGPSSVACRDVEG
ncbi:hypothetical protein [Micromonospora sp. NBC_00858]|uniref:hypothetical protein n=1 Tax=Micromonospora sp. NBC_00858 TaxID=2975979 RepID=UPI00386BEE83|nr:hypothetical protein OG990_04635 [Micromonospora sp. NBC_00858]